MKNINHKPEIPTIVLTVILAFTTISLGISTVIAQEYPTACFLAAEPSPVGLGQYVTISVMVQPVPPSSTDVYHDVELKITKPNGEIETYTRDTFTHGAYYIQYTPDMVGTYNLQMSYPGEYFASLDQTRAASISPVVELVVQADPIPSWPEIPPTDDFWTRPINADLREWASISGNWLQNGYNTTYRMGRTPCAYNPYSKAPRAPHILWTEELGLGGLVGGEYGSTSYYGGLVYEQYLQPPVIMNGRLYYNLYFSSSPFDAFVCVDLRTGEELWRVENASISVGQLYDHRSINQYGVIPFLWATGSTYELYDAFSGRHICSFENASNGRIVFDDDGTMLVYMLSGRNNMVSMWNSTKAFNAAGFYSWQNNEARELGVYGASFRPRTGEYDWTDGIEWEVTVPNVNMTYAGRTYYPSAYSISGDVILAEGGPGFSDRRLHAGYSTEDGSLLWAFEREETEPLIRSAVGDGVFAKHNTVSTRFHGYDINTGVELWRSDPNVYPWGTYIGLAMLIADGKLLAGSYDGYLHAFDITTGNEMWKYYSGDSGYETPLESWPLGFYGTMVADGVVFAANGEHSASQPLYRGEKLHAIDIETGEGIWNLTGWYQNYAIVDGYLITHDAYNNLMVVIGKGPSATTVEAPKASIELGRSLIISGRVTDVSAGTKQAEQIARFPNGVPAVSDASMSAWMEYVYQQKPIPDDVEGVEVFLKIQDPNGDYYGAYVTTDKDGMFSLKWSPALVGEYHVTAIFEGSESYSTSYSTTTFGVDAAPTSPEYPTVDEIAAESASRTIAMMPQYPDVPTQEAIADDAARRTIAMLPQYPECNPCPEIPAYLTIDLVVIVLVIVAIIIGIYSLIKKQK